MRVGRAVTHLSALWGDGAMPSCFAFQSHGPAQAHQGPVGGPDPGVACRAPRDAQVSAGWVALVPAMAVRVLKASPRVWQSSER